MVVHLNNGVNDDGDESENNGREKPHVDELGVGSLRELVGDLGEQSGEHQQCRQGHHDTILKVKPLEEERGKGDEVDESGGDEDGHNLWEEREE